MPIMAGLLRFKKFTISEKFFCLLFLIGIIPALFFPIKELIFFIYSVITIATYVAQPIEIFRNKNSGTVEPKLHFIYLGSAIFWVIYGFVINDTVLKLTIMPHVGIALTTALLCYKYKQPKQIPIHPIVG